MKPIYYHIDEHRIAGSGHLFYRVLGWAFSTTPENLKISLVIIDCGDEFLIYMPLQAKFPALGVFEKHLNQSFTSRLEAICNWFIMQF